MHAAILLTLPLLVPLGAPAHAAEGDRPTIHVFTTAGCGPCRQLYRDVRDSEALASFVWRFHGDRAPRPEWVTAFPTLVFQGAGGKWWKTEGWPGEKRFMRAWRSVQ